MNVYWKIAIVSLATVLAVILLIGYLYIYNKRLNKSGTIKKKRLLDPYKVLGLVMMVMVLVCTTLLAIPNNFKTDGSLDGEPVPPSLAGDDTKVEPDINIYINVNDISKEQKKSLEDKIAKSGIQAKVIYQTLAEKVDNIDIIVTSERITSNIFIDDYHVKKDSLISLMEILESEFIN